VIDGAAAEGAATGERARWTRSAWRLLAVAVVVLIVSGIAPRDRATWWLEVAPVVIGGTLCAATARRFPFTPLVQWLLLIHAAILCVGGHWTYAEVPLGNWVRDALSLSRNPYDRLGHLAQGFVPALVAREVFLRRAVVRRGAWLFTIVTAFALAISAAYELCEWLAAETMGQAADSFLGTQGDPWDTQWDMLCALIGAITSQLLLGRVHARMVARIAGAG
jgi:putative membrane protein